MILVLISFSLEAESKDGELLLYSQFGEFCTMCEAVLLCGKNYNTDSDSIPNDGNYTLYHLKTRTFWSQISTIWEFFIKNFEGYEVKGHTRPVRIFEIMNNVWQQKGVYEAEILLDPNLIKVDSIEIDRNNNSWLNKDGNSLGYCQRLPLWDSLDVIDSKTSVGN